MQPGYACCTVYLVTSCCIHSPQSTLRTTFGRAEIKERFAAIKTIAVQSAFFYPQTNNRERERERGRELHFWEQLANRKESKSFPVGCSRLQRTEEEAKNKCNNPWQRSAARRATSMVQRCPSGSARMLESEARDSLPSTAA